MVKQSKITPPQLLEDLQHIYELALAQDQFALALKAKELQAKYFVAPEKPILDLEKLSVEELNLLLEKYECNTPP